MKPTDPQIASAERIVTPLTAEEEDLIRAESRGGTTSMYSPAVTVKVISRLLATLDAARTDSLDEERLAEASVNVEEEDERVGVVGRGRKIDRIAAEYAALSKEETSWTCSRPTRTWGFAYFEKRARPALSKEEK